MDTFDTLSNKINVKTIQETATHKLAHFSPPKSFEHTLEQDALQHLTPGPEHWSNKDTFS
jgi:hypothetical protein